MTRNELIAEIGKTIFYQGSPSKINRQHTEILSDFILSRDKEKDATIKKLWEGIGKVEKSLKKHTWGHKSVEEALETIAKIKGEMKWKRKS